MSESMFETMSEYDDVMTDLLVDSVYLGYVSHKMNTTYVPWSINATQEEKNQLAESLSDIIRRFLDSKVRVNDLVHYWTTLFFPNREITPPAGYVEPVCLHSDLVTRVIAHLSQSLRHSEKDPDLSEFRSQLKIYITSYDKKSGFEVCRTTRYRSSDKIESRLMATRNWEIGHLMELCVGVTVVLTEEQERTLRNDFSIIYSRKRKKHCLLLGPARFANHDCSPNVEFVAVGERNLVFRVIKPISRNSEILVQYSPNYFGENNCDCLCATCESLLKGGFKPDESEVGEFKTERKSRAKNGVIRAGMVDLSRFQAEEVKEEGTCCKWCSGDIDSTEADLASWSGAELQTLLKKCKRCIRHYSIFKFRWPCKNELQVKQYLKEEANKNTQSELVDIFGATIFDSAKAKKHHSNSKQSKGEATVRTEVKNMQEEELPVTMLDASTVPVAVWVDPCNKNEPHWWPGLIVPEEEAVDDVLSYYKKQKGRKIVISYFEAVDGEPSFTVTYRKNARILTLQGQRFKNFERYHGKQSEIVQSIRTFITTGNVPDIVKWTSEPRTEMQRMLAVEVANGHLKQIRQRFGYNFVKENSVIAQEQTEKRKSIAADIVQHGDLNLPRSPVTIQHAFTTGNLTTAEIKAVNDVEKVRSKEEERQATTVFRRNAKLKLQRIGKKLFKFQLLAFRLSSMQHFVSMALLDLNEVFKPTAAVAESWRELRDRFEQLKSERLNKSKRDDFEKDIEAMRTRIDNVADYVKGKNDAIKALVMGLNLTPDDEDMNIMLASMEPVWSVKTAGKKARQDEAGGASASTSGTKAPKQATAANAYSPIAGTPQNASHGTPGAPPSTLRPASAGSVGQTPSAQQLTANEAPSSQSLSGASASAANPTMTVRLPVESDEITNYDIKSPPTPVLAHQQRPKSSTKKTPSRPGSQSSGNSTPDLSAVKRSLPSQGSASDVSQTNEKKLSSHKKAKTEPSDGIYNPSGVHGGKVQQTITGMMQRAQDKKGSDSKKIEMAHQVVNAVRRASNPQVLPMDTSVTSIPQPSAPVEQPRNAGTPTQMMPVINQRSPGMNLNALVNPPASRGTSAPFFGPLQQQMPVQALLQAPVTQHNVQMPFNQGGISSPHFMPPSNVSMSPARVSNISASVIHGQVQQPHYQVAPSVQLDEMSFFVPVEVTDPASSSTESGNVQTASISSTKATENQDTGSRKSESRRLSGRRQRGVIETENYPPTIGFDLNDRESWYQDESETSELVWVANRDPDAHWIIGLLIPRQHLDSSMGMPTRENQVHVYFLGKEGKCEKLHRQLVRPFVWNDERYQEYLRRKGEDDDALEEARMIALRGKKPGYLVSPFIVLPPLITIEDAQEAPKQTDRGSMSDVEVQKQDQVPEKLVEQGRVILAVKEETQKQMDERSVPRGEKKRSIKDRSARRQSLPSAAKENVAGESPQNKAKEIINLKDYQKQVQSEATVVVDQDAPEPSDAQRQSGPETAVENKILDKRLDAEFNDLAGKASDNDTNNTDAASARMTRRNSFPMCSIDKELIDNRLSAPGVLRRSSLSVSGGVSKKTKKRQLAPLRKK